MFEQNDLLKAYNEQFDVNSEDRVETANCCCCDTIEDCGCEACSCAGGVVCYIVGGIVGLGVIALLIAYVFPAVFPCFIDCCCGGGV